MSNYDLQIQKLHQSVDNISESPPQEGFLSRPIVKKIFFILVLYIIFVILLVSVRPNFILTDNVIDRKKMLLYSLLFTLLVLTLWWFRHSIMSMISSIL